MRCVCWLALFCFLLAAEARAEQPIDYVRDIKPLLARRCYACHGALKQQSGLRLDTAEAIRRGGEGGPAIEPGNSGESVLIDALTGTNGRRQMPPKDEGKPLSAEEVALVRRWIDAGAAASRDEAPQRDPRQHWAFQRIERPAVPKSSGEERTANPIDAFIAVEQH